MTQSAQLLERLQLQLPIIQAPMAGTATPQLAAAVSEAGGLGSLGLGASTLAQARQAIRDTRALTARPFNVNFFCHAPAVRDAAREAAWLAHLQPLFDELKADAPTLLEEIYPTFVGDDAMLAMLFDERPAVVSFHFGLPPASTVQALRAAGIYTIASATSVEEAQLIEQAGVDAIVAQGYEAGGHRGVFDPDARDEKLPAFVLLRQLVRQTSLPVIAAGGMMDGAGVQAALQLGAAAAQLGTAFIACPESAASASYRANLLGERAGQTRMTSVLSGRPARGMVNRYIEHGEAPGSPPPAAYPVAYDAAKQLNAAAVKLGQHEFAAQWAGQGAPLARALPAAELMALLAREYGKAAGGC
ncbi:NAD(P)H-dependent flavin oxidoreductase [Janthinobacterium aquaticum]|uniref:NAD(P)H-dependent flavin oxidoreductase n=1 Tax=Janthinobacterium sp. FT58W TaxID=2654254 RepID=UPI001263F9DA|nr:nitronate monooxygenase [Janthinobacterium sp. FT58W]KAB8038564.1 nitronate monooxygenase [Janthinobacterium sp. FT58W]